MLCLVHFNQTHHQSYTLLSYQTAAASVLNRPNHSQTPSLSKCPASPPSKEHPDAALNKCPCSFCTNAPQPSQSTAYQSHETYPQTPMVLPVCAVCLRRHKHIMPVIYCAAKCTWDDQFETLVKQFNKVLRIRETGATLCSSWQHDNGCAEKHDNMHLCSGCRALTHSACRCPHAQKATAQKPYKVEAWKQALCQAGLLEHFSFIPSGLHKGFTVGYPTLAHVQTPPNSTLLSIYEEFKEIVNKELTKEHYIGPFLFMMIEAAIGPLWRPMSPWPCIHISHTILSSFHFPLPFADHPDQSAIQSMYPLIRNPQSAGRIA